MFLRNALTLILLAATTLSIGCSDNQQESNNFARPDSIGFIGVRSDGNKVQVATMPAILSEQQLTTEQTQKALAKADWQDVNPSQIINNSDDVAKSKVSNNSFYFIQTPKEYAKRFQGTQSSSSNVYGYYPYYRPYGGYYYTSAYGYNNWYWPTYYTAPYYNYYYWPTYYYSYNWWYYQPVYSYTNYYGYNYYWYARWW